MNKILINFVILMLLSTFVYAQVDFASLTLAQKLAWLENPENFNHPEYVNRLLQYAPLKDNQELWFNYLNKVDVTDKNENAFFRYLNDIDDTSVSQQKIADKFFTEKRDIKENIVPIANKFIGARINGNIDLSLGKAEYLGDWKLKNGNIELDLDDKQYIGSNIRSLSNGGFEIFPKQAIKFKENLYKVPVSSKLTLNNDFSVDL